MSTKFKNIRIDIVANGYVAYTGDNDFGCTRSDDSIFVFTSPATLAAWLEKNIVVPAACYAEAAVAAGCCGGQDVKVPQDVIEELEQRARERADANKAEQRRFDERLAEVNRRVRESCVTKLTPEEYAKRCREDDARPGEVERDPEVSREENARKFAPEDEDYRGQEVPSLPTITSREGAAIVHEAMAKTYKQAERAVHDGKAVSIPGV